MEFLLRCLVVFVTTAIVDWMWAKYIMHAAKRDAFRAASYGSLLMLGGAFVTISYMHDKLFLLPAIAGGFLGTYLTVRFSKE